MNPKDLPVYHHKDRILEALQNNSVIVVESPTGSGKTTQLPIILHEAGYDQGGMVGVTQPRRIAAVSVASFIQRQIGEKQPGLVGYKMRFDDRTSRSTRIKIMTDGILLQELKLDPILSNYSVIMVDEAHERSLNIDFILGLLKRVIEQRPDFKVIVSSATINAEVFSEYFGACPIVRIDTVTHPVSVIYRPPQTPKRDENKAEQQTGRFINPRGRRDEAPNPRRQMEETIVAVTDIIGHIVDEKREGDVLIFLPGEKAIKDCMQDLNGQSFKRKLHIVPLYGKLSKEEQDLVFVPTPRGKMKIVVATNIAETSLTIEGITSVIDCGNSKINFYNPRTFTSSLIERPISKASANQRKGRAGRTQPGTCYRLYTKDDFETRPLFTQEEIYRTDLSEVVLRMAELGIRDFESFDFISSPGKEGIAGAVEILLLLEALEPDNSLSKVGEMMAQFPLLPRHSRILVEAILKYPDIIEEALIGTAFLSCDTPFLLPQGEELEARKAHHTFRDANGDFLSYIRLYRAYTAAEKKAEFCKRYYLDEQSIAEIANVKDQLQMIVSAMGVPVLSAGPSLSMQAIRQYLCAVSKGLIQFICIRSSKTSYRSLTAEKIEIHPSSVMFKETPPFIVAGEVVKTTKMYARSVSPLRKEWLIDINAELAKSLVRMEDGRPMTPPVLAPRAQAGRAAVAPRSVPKLVPVDSTWQVLIAGKIFNLEVLKGKKKLLPLAEEDLDFLLKNSSAKSVPEAHANLRSCLRVKKGITVRDVLDGERLAQILAIADALDWPQHMNWAPTSVPKARFSHWESLDPLIDNIEHVLSLADAKKGAGFMTLYANQEGFYWFKATLSFSTALSESLGSLEYLADSIDKDSHPRAASEVSKAYRRLSGIIERV